MARAIPKEPQAREEATTKPDLSPKGYFRLFGPHFWRFAIRWHDPMILPPSGDQRTFLEGGRNGGGPKHGPMEDPTRSQDGKEPRSQAALQKSSRDLREFNSLRLMSSLS